MLGYQSEFSDYFLYFGCFFVFRSCSRVYTLPRHGLFIVSSTLIGRIVYSFSNFNLTSTVYLAGTKEKVACTMIV